MNFAIIMIGISSFRRCETNFVYIINYDSDNVLYITISPYLWEEAHEFVVAKDHNISVVINS